MSAPVEPVPGDQPPAATDPAAAAAAATGATPQEVSSATKISTMEDLKQKAPTVYQAVLEGIATNMINQMKRRQDRLKEIMREARRNAGYS